MQTKYMNLIKKITTYNNWRRGSEDALKFTPTEIGLFLDEACVQLQTLIDKSPVASSDINLTDPVINENWTQYKRKGLSEMRPFIVGETLTLVSISDADRENGSPKKGDMIARNPKNYDDQWLVAAKYLEDNLELADKSDYASKPVDAIKTNLETLAKLEETEIRKHVVNGIYKGDIRIKSKYVLPNLSDIIVTGDFYCSDNNLTSLEGAPKEVTGCFNCYCNNLTSLEGVPKEVGGYFNCSDNNLTSLEGAPKEVGGGYYCNYNNLTSLEGAPKEVEGDFDCSDNNLTSLEGAPKEVGGDFDCYGNNLTSLEGAPKKSWR